MTIFKIPPEFTYATEAGEDLTGDLNKFVKVNAAGKLVLPTTQGESVFGTLIEEAVADGPASAQFGGIAKIKLGGTVNPGQRVMSTNGGLAVVATAGNQSPGYALKGGLINEVIPIALMSSQL